MPKVKLSWEQGAALLDQSPSVGVVAGYGSGKTYLALAKIFDLLFTNPGVPVAYAAPSYPLISDIFYPALEEHCITHGIAYDINRGRNVVSIPYLGNIICRSMSNPGKLVGWEAGAIILDEFDVLPIKVAHEGWKKLKARARYKYPKYSKRKQKETGKKRRFNQMFAVSTPEGFRAFYDLFKREPVPGSSLHHMTTYANLKNLPEDYIQELLRNYPREYIKAYIMGQFTNLTTGRVWKRYDRRENRTGRRVRGKEPLLVGMDFNVGRGCAVIYVGDLKDKEKLYAVDEVFNSFDTPDTIKILQSRYPDNPVTVIPDATGKNRKSVNATTSDLALLKLAGYRLMVNNSNPNIKDRVAATNSRFCDPFGVRKLFVNDKRCPNYADALEQQSYDENGMPEKGIGKFDDLTDAGSYPIAKLWPIRKVISTTQELII